MRIIRMLAPGLGLLILALVAACSGTTSPSDTLDICSLDDDCPFGQYCEGGVCASGLGPCAEFDVCPDGQECRHGACVATGDPDGGVDGDGGLDGGDDEGDQNPGGPDIEIVSPPLSGDPPGYQLNFGNVAVGVVTQQQVLIENAGDENLRILQINMGLGAGNEDFSIPQGTLDALPLTVTPGDQIAIDVIYLASDGSTDHGVLDIISNDPDEASVRVELLSEFKGEQSVAATPASLDFGDVPVGDTSAPLTLTISNQGTGNAVLTIEDLRFGVLQNPDFDLSVFDVDGQPVDLPALLNPGDALDVVVSYHPQAAADDADEVVVISNDPLQASLSVPITGRGVVGDLNVSPSPAALGRVRVGQSGDLIATITNAGGAPLDLTGVSLFGLDADWSLTSVDLDLADLANTPHSLAAAEAVTVQISFAPSSAGAMAGQLLIDHSGPAAQTSLAVSGEGYVPPAVETDPDPADLLFGDVQIDVGSGLSDSRTLPLTIRNVGGEPLQVTDILRAPGTSLEFRWSPASLAPINPGQEAQINVTFEPTNTGDKVGLLLIDTDDPDIAYAGEVGRIGVNLQARGTDPFIFVSPAAAHDFGVTNIAQHKQLDVTIRNASSFPLNLTNIRMTAGSAAYYTLSDLPPLPMVIPDSILEVHFTVNYDPTATGVHTGAVEILSSDLGHPVVTLALAGDCQGCPVGMADCNAGIPGCETNILNDVNNCGGCGNACTNNHGTTTCSGGFCVPTCSGDWGDCDNDPDNGCELDLTSLSDCGACDQTCSLPHADETCAMGTCEIDDCDAGYSDCTGSAGCETNTYSDVNNCGNCNIDCTNAHGSTSCIANNCTPVCSSLWGDCDGDPEDGCETALNTAINCAVCGGSCSLAHATESCASGTCQITDCDAGWCDLNGQPANGCEYDLDVNPACGTYTHMGTISGDENNPDGSHDELVEVGRGEAWFRFYVAETYENWQDCLYLSGYVALTVPPGTNYNLHTYCDDCVDGSGSSSNSGSTDEYTEFRWDEGCFLGFPTGSTDSRYMYVWIEFADGDVCTPWTLTVSGNWGVASNTCETP